LDTVIRFGSDTPDDPAVDRLHEDLAGRLGTDRVGRNERDSGLGFATVLVADGDWWAHVDAMAEFADDHADLLRPFLAGEGRWARFDVAVWPSDRAEGGRKSLLLPSEVLRAIAFEGVAVEVTVYDR
jgi:hypothetical protein